MIAHLLAVEIKAVADALALSTPELAALHICPPQTKEKRRTPALVIVAELVRSYHQGRNGVVRLTLTVESVAGDEGKPDPNNHLSRVRLAHRLFLDEKSARIAALNARGNLSIDDWGKLPAKVEAGNDPTGDKLRSPLVLLVACRIAANGNLYSPDGVSTYSPDGVDEYAAPPV